MGKKQMQFTEEPVQVMMLGETKVRIFAPIMTPEEYQKRDEAIHAAIASILKSKMEAAAGA
ncbi:hypothetical protein [Tumebacillus permanentifrigoris]|uniref:hypothetical protein n=1 Tax=Tumebacillus permanentifrigoris TaxID=378543 RepID=UPI000D6CEB98|nr:hypothetical protein [Tumebacillus permanentifrigoris]